MMFFMLIKLRKKFFKLNFVSDDILSRILFSRVNKLAYFDAKRDFNFFSVTARKIWPKVLTLLKLENLICHDIEHNDEKHNDTRHHGVNCDTRTNIFCCYAVCHYVNCHYAECFYAECHYTAEMLSIVKLQCECRWCYYA